MSKRGENIYKRKDGRWEGRYIKERSADGKARYAYVYGKSYADAKQKLLIPHRECVHNGMCKDGCDFKLRSGADFVASRLVNTLLYDVADKTAFVKLLVQLDRPILEVLKDNPTITPSVRLSNCIKIKFLRKALLVKSFGITKAEYEMILKHPNFLKGGSRDA